jgi:LPPG:FO 2-phospho-L-lactate transferase
MRILAITGGVGGAKLALGLSKILSPEELTFIVNTGDDFEHLGYHISPDVDTLVYTLAGKANLDTGWGRRNETWHFMESLAELGGETWFRLGDRDLALHAYRRRRLGEGATLTKVTAEVCSRFGIEHRVLPMSNDPVRTRVITPDGELEFQHYFVRDRCKPTALGFEFAGIKNASINPAIIAAFDTRPDAIVICPSNPFVSIDPILSLPTMGDRLRATNAMIVAVSPIVAGKALKGPTAKMMKELAIPATAIQIACHYRELIDGFVLDSRDAANERDIKNFGLETVATQTVMVTLEDRVDLAHAVLEFIAQGRD